MSESTRSAGRVGVTVVVPAWDKYVEFLPETVASITSQEPAPHLVIVDNASAFGIAQAGAEVVRLPERVSRGAARNAGLAVVQTEFVVFWDADDLMPTGALAHLRAGIDAGPNVSVVFGAIRERGTGEAHHWPPRSVLRLSERQRSFALADLAWARFSVTGAILRTDQVRAARGYSDADVAEDWPLAAVLAARGRVSVSSTPTMLYRVHASSRAHAQPTELARQGRAAVRLVIRDPGAAMAVRMLAPLVLIPQQLIAYVLWPLWSRLRASRTVRRARR